MKTNNPHHMSDAEDTNQEIERVRRTLVVVLTLVGTFISTIYALLNFTAGNTGLAVTEAVASVILLCAALFVLVRKDISVAKWILAGVLLMFEVLLLVTGGFEQAGLLWLYAFPPVLFLLLNAKTGARWLAIMIAIPLVLGVLDFFDIYTLAYEYSGLAQFTGSFLLAAVFTFAYQLQQERQTKLLNSYGKRQEMLADSSFKQRKQLQTVLKSIGDGVIVLDSKKRIVLVNPVAQQLTGFTEKDLLDKQFGETLKFINDKTGEEVTDFIDTIYESGKGTSLDFHTSLVKQNGDKLAVGDSAAPILNDKGDVSGGVIVFRDSTLEREIDTMKTEFVSLASHQLQTPITELQYLLELIKDSELLEEDVDPKELIDKAYEISRSMSDLVSDLLDVSRIETGRKFSIKKTPSDLVKLIGEIVSETAEMAKQRPVTIEQQIECDCVNVNIDPGKIAEVLRNLISNAIKYSYPDGTIILRLKQNENNAIIEVEDHGIGIPRDQQGSIFSKMFRADNAKKADINGTGLGLYIAKAIATAHGGKLFFESEENVRTIFTLELPLHSQDTETKEDETN